MTASDASFSHLSPVKRALLAIERLREQTDRFHQPIAIIGMGCRFPGGANSPERFWELLKTGRDAFGAVPADRFDVETSVMPMTRGAFLDQVDGFDAAFFSMSPREAVQTDPRQRLFLEVAWEALEHAGIDPTRLNGSATGVFAGAFADDYAHLDLPLGERVDPYYFSGVSIGFTANRLSYCLGLRGPSLTVDTACSSSLVALHLATRALRLGECDLALAGGVSLILSPEISLFLSRAGTLSPTGLCRAFDQHADGLVRGEGGGVVVLKRLVDAHAAGDRILAVIRGSAVNHGGASGGLTVPNPTAQSDLYRAALRDAGVRPEQVSHLEAHGTGTRLGDPIELLGLSEVYGGGRPQPLYIGSVKTNIGHTDAAAGVAGLIKSVLMLKNREIPPSPHFRDPTSEFAWSAHDFVVPTRCRPLPGDTVAISAFGLGGANAHMILEAAPQSPAESLDTGPLLLALSARHPTALRQLAGAVAQQLSTARGSEAVDLCATAARSRAGLPYRLAVAGRDGRELAQRLAQWRIDPPAGWSEAVATHEWRTVFVFSGQGGQWCGMGWELCRENPVFAARIREIDTIFKPLAGRGILPDAAADPDAIHETAIAQPAIFAMQLGLAAVWQHLGVTPDAVVGHSMGEVAAAHIAGCLDLAGAVRVIYHRSRLLQTATGQGTMIAAALTLEQAQALLEPYHDQVSVAAVNGPNAVVLSGAAPALARLAAELERRGVFQRELQVRFASHCPQMDRYQQPLREALAPLQVLPPSLPLYSTVTGRLVEGAEMDAGYWAANIREPVLFAPAIGALIGQGANAFVELSPHPVLESALLSCLDAAGSGGAVVGSTHRAEPEQAALLASACALYRSGYPIDPARVTPAGQVVTLPSYPWQRQRYWLNTSVAGGSRASVPGSGHPLLGEKLASPLAQSQYQSVLLPSSPAFLADHGLRQSTYLPATALLEMALAAAHLEGLQPTVHDLRISAPITLDDEPVRLHTVLEPGEQRRALTMYSSRDGRQWQTHARATLGADAPVEGAALTHAPMGSPPSLPSDGSDESDRSVRSVRSVGFHPSRLPGSPQPDPPGNALDVERFYTGLAQRGYRYEGAFRAIARLRHDGDQLVAHVAMPEDTAAYHFHPAALDACLHAALALLPDDLYVPVAVERFQLVRRPHGDARCVVRPRPPTAPGPSRQFDIAIHDAEGICALVHGLTLQTVALARDQRPAWQDWCFQLRWTARPSPPLNEAPAGTFLLLAGKHAKAHALRQFLENRGHDCVSVRPGASFAQLAPGLFELDPRQPASFQYLLDQLEREGRRPSQILFAWALDLAPLDQQDPDQWAASFRTIYGGALHLVQALEARRPAPRLWLLTSGAQPFGEQRVQAAQAGLWGFGGVIARELPFLSCANVDLDPASDDPRYLYRELRAEPDEARILLRRGERYVSRLATVSFPPHQPRSFRVGLERYGQLDNLQLMPLPIPPPGPGQVLIQTQIVPLNFRDALNALGMLADYAARLGIEQAASMPFGFECGGVVLAVGEAVSHLAVGDRVVAGPITGALASHAVADARRVFVVPPSLDLDAVAGLPVVFMTACYGLEHLARLQPGERVLIHAATGGVGMVAVQLAQRAGAEIYATAHPDKWPVLREMGVIHVLNSRDNGFGQEVLRITQGRGVDVVLNSLSGPLIEASLLACAPGARFIELGKKDSWSAEQVARLRPDIRYHAFTFSEVADQQPDLVARLQRELVERLADGRLQPLPLHRFDLQDIVAAFRFLAQARHTGKVAIELPRSAGLALRPDGCYWITGGMGALGLEVARWLLDRGARHLLLTGRRPTDADLDARLAPLRQPGVRVEYQTCDVASGPAVDRLVQDLVQEGIVLRGLIHAAGVIDDAMIAGQSLDRFARVFEPKGLAILNLHRATASLPLELFVIFSSTAAILGPPGQSNYAIANAIMDAVAHDRRAQDLPALSLNWGPWAESGLAAGMSERNRERLAARGMDFIPPEQGIAAMEALIALPLAQAAILPVNWARYLADLPAGVDIHLFEAFTHRHTQPPRAFLAQLESAPPAQHRALLEAFIREQIARALGLPDPGQIGARQRLFDLGVDSLMAVELRNRLEAGLKRPLRATLLFDFPRLDALTQHLADDVLHLAPSTTGPTAARTNGSSSADAHVSTTGGDLDLSRLDQLSPGDLGSMVEEKLAAMARFLDDEP